MRPLLLLALVLVLLMSTPQGHAFTPRSRAFIVSKALTLMPDAVQTQMERHLRPLLSGALEGTEETGPAGIEAYDPGDRDKALVAAVDETVARLDAQEPMSRVAASMGAIARATADLSFPLNVGESDSREESFYLAYARFVESRQGRIVVTFDGFADRNLAAGNVRGFARDLAESARRDYDGVLRSYFPEGRKSLPGDFDDRSIAFATASLGVSRAVEATAQAWLYAWHRAHGDLSGAPGIERSHPFGPSPGTAPGPDREGTRAQAEEEKR